MAVRLNVVVIRPEGAATRWSDTFDDCLGQLLGRPGLDLVLLDRLPRPDEVGTERLAVETIQGDVACLAWTDGDFVAERFGQLDKPVHRVAHRRDRPPQPEIDTAGMSSKPKLYFFDMRVPAASSTIVDDLQHLLEVRRTPTFQILTPPTGSTAPSNLPSNSPSKSPGKSNDLPGAARSTTKSGDQDREPGSLSRKKAESPQSFEPVSHDAETDGDALDKLLDDLDACDL